MKECTKCETEKEITEFHKRAKNPDGLRRWCKLCHNGYNAQWARDNREKVREGDNARYAKNPSIKINRVAERRSRKCEWSNKDDMEEIYLQAKLFTDYTGIQHEVHHIYPLVEFKDIFSGLHNEHNLIILTKEEHLEAHRQLRKQYGRR